MLYHAKIGGRPCRRDCLRYACTTNAIVESYIVVIEAQVYFAITTNAHADGVMLIEGLLEIVGKCEVLPVAS